MNRDTAHISIQCVANLYVRQMVFKKTNDIERGHVHCFDHTTLLAKGSLEVTVKGKTSIFKAPQMIFIKAEHVHELIALEDDTIAYCIHALRDGEGVNDIIDPVGIPEGLDPLTLSKSLIVFK